MPIICRKDPPKKIKLKVEICEDVLNEINQYMSWAEVNNTGYFLEEAARFIFKNDRDWKRFKKGQKGSF